MTKYYIALFLLAGAVLYWVFIQDPCGQLVKKDFAARYPEYEIVFTGATDGSPESVHCHITYEKPGSKTVYEDVWLYLNQSDGWEFSRIVTTEEKDD